MDEIEAGKAAFLAILAEVSPEATAVIPSRATDDNFLISLTTEAGRVFLTVSEDDLIDLPEDDDVSGDVRRDLVAAIEKLG